MNYLLRGDDGHVERGLAGGQGEVSSSQELPHAYIPAQRDPLPFFMSSLDRHYQAKKKIACDRCREKRVSTV